MAERELANIADDEVEARRQHHRKHDEYADMQGILIQDEKRRQQRSGQYTQQAIAFENHQARSACLPKRPYGRTSSIAMTSPKPIAST